ncbi:MAG: FAD-binding oxidoreductase [Pseudomonadota bacterium]
MKLSRRKLLATGAAGAVAFLQPRIPPARAAAKAKSLVLNDAGKLSPTPVARHIVVRPNEDEAILAELRTLLKDAAAENRPVAIGGARHSMGGQSLPRDGVAGSLVSPLCVPDVEKKTYRARAGARWRDIIKTLDPLGFSPKVMQSNSDFSVGGTLSVNAHGWPAPFGPFGTTVKSFRLMLADGTLLTCSPNENPELFGLAIGGYGLFGIVVDMDVEMVDNVLLVANYDVVPKPTIGERFANTANGDGVKMAYGRLNVAREAFLAEGLVVSYKAAEAQPKSLPLAERSGAYSFVSRQLYRAQVGSERAKRARWYAETNLLPKAAAAKPLTRNAILSYPVSILAENSPRRVDILHEYFLPAERVLDFQIACAENIPETQDLLNVTLRYVESDPVSVMAFAPKPRVAAVMSFSQAVTPKADEAARAMTERLIEAVIDLGGSYYLPYRLHAKPEQFKAAYPKAEQFAAKKRHYDPQLRFRNALWDRYFA